MQTTPLPAEPSNSVQNFLAQFVCTPLTPEQQKVSDKAGDLDAPRLTTEENAVRVQVLEICRINCGLQKLDFLGDHNAMRLVRQKMSASQQRAFYRALSEAVLRYRPGDWFTGKLEEFARVFEAPASLQARIAYEVLRSDVPDESRLDLAREGLEHSETRETLGMEPARRL